MRRFRIVGEERGATAVEYGLIAGLIALGILGSLVGTRTSLIAAFGGISGQMGSATGGAPAASPAPTVTSQRAITPASSSARAPYWNAKTLASKTVSNPSPTSQLTTFTYTDGASGSYLANFDSTGKLLSEVVVSYPLNYSGRTMDSLQFTYGADGTQQSMIYTDRYANGGARQVSTSAAANGWAETVKYYDSNGNLTSSGSSGTTGSGVLQTGSADEVYFRALANQ
jgi:pilus assembly protein Flp/PilA